jgi:hypothetical protein
MLQAILSKKWQKSCQVFGKHRQICCRKMTMIAAVARCLDWRHAAGTNAQTDWHAALDQRRS